MYYHASSVKGITQLTPQSSNHGIPLVYFSTKRENVLVYLSNSIEKYCVETGFSYNGNAKNGGRTVLVKMGGNGWKSIIPML